MTNKNRTQILALALFAIVGLSACSDESDSTSSTTIDAGAESDTTEKDEDHEDEHDDHDDDDHDDDDHDDDDHDDDKDKSGLSSHEHGAAELSVAWTEGDMVIDLISPTDSIFGFENEATTPEEIEIVETQTQAISDPALLAINSEAGCTLVGQADTELEIEGSHSEITVSWTYECENPDAIEQLDASGLFSEFAAIEDVDVQWASDSDQSAAELTPSASTLSFQ